MPLGELGGRPRVDCLCNMSGIFRDSFQNVVELLDDLFQRAAAADEPPESNFIRCPGLTAYTLTQNRSGIYLQGAGALLHQAFQQRPGMQLL